MPSNSPTQFKVAELVLKENQNNPTGSFLSTLNSSNLAEIALLDGSNTTACSETNITCFYEFHKREIEYASNVTVGDLQSFGLIKKSDPIEYTLRNKVFGTSDEIQKISFIKNLSRELSIVDSNGTAFIKFSQAEASVSDVPSPPSPSPRRQGSLSSGSGHLSVEIALGIIAIVGTLIF